MGKIKELSEIKDQKVLDIMTTIEKIKEDKPLIVAVSLLEHLNNDIYDLYDSIYNGDTKYANASSELERVEEQLRNIINKYDITKIGLCSVCENVIDQLKNINFE